jgi:hypothetical protein
MHAVRTQAAQEVYDQMTGESLHEESQIRESAKNAFLDEDAEG